MRTDAQRQASRINGSKSRGPTTPEGKNITKFNGLTHGLCSKHVVLPGEDPAAFEAEHQAWQNDWQPASHTRARLVERAAITSWRLLRCVRVETERLGEVVAEAVRQFDEDRLARVERTVDLAPHDPRTALATLRCEVTGVDRLLRGWREMAAALEAGPGGWSQPLFHTRLLCLTGHAATTTWTAAGQPGEDSWRLLGLNTDRPDTWPAEPGEPEAIAARLRDFIIISIAELEERRATLPDVDEGRRSAVAAAVARDAEKGETRHRYEMAHDRALRGIVSQLMALSRSGADLGDAGDSSPSDGVAVVSSAGARSEAESDVDATGVTRTLPQPPGGAGGSRSRDGNPGNQRDCGDESAEAPGSVGAGESWVVLGHVTTPDGAVTDPDRAPKAAGKGRMRR